MTLTFDNIKLDSESFVYFLDGSCHKIILNFDTNKVFFIESTSKTETIFFNYKVENSRYLFRVPGPSGKGSFTLSISTDGTLKFEGLYISIPQWVTDKIKQSFL